MKIWNLVSVWFTLTLPFACYAQDPAGGTPVGFIQKLSGNVVLCNRDNCDANSGIKLRPDQDKGRILFDNQSLKCEDKSVVEVHTSASYPGKDETQFAPDLCIGRKSSWIHMPASRGPALKGQNQIFETALRSYGRRAGRDKGSESPIYSPADQGSVIPKKFVVQWRTKPPLGKIAVSLVDGDGRELGHVEDVAGDTGLLDSEALRKALDDYRDAKDSDREVRLTFKTASGETGVKFSILSVAHENELQRALEQINSSHGIFQYVERASIFESFRMYDKAAAEYDEALKEAPSSQDMLQASFNAHAKIGDLRRARELRDKLKEAEATQEKN